MDVDRKFKKEIHHAIELLMGYRLLEAIYELTLRCNLHCRHCGSNAGKPRTSELSLAESLALIHDLNELGVYMITLNGGEPFLNPHWARIGKEINDHGIKLGLITNGYGIKDDVMRAVAALDIYEVGISLDGGRAVHDSIRCKGSYESAIATIKKLHEKNVPVGVITTVSKMNLDALGDVLATILSCGVDAWQVQVAIPMGRMAKEFLINNEEYKQMIDFIHGVRTEFPGKVYLNGGDCVGLGAKSLVTDHVYTGGICSAGTRIVGIHSNGDVVGCLAMIHDDYIEGNLRDRSITDIWLDEGAFAYNRKPAGVAGKCTGCNQADACRAGCKSMNIACGHPNESLYCARF
jgi:radical SAM protein with 4Fe4S-binding SPASM domain